MPSGSLAKRRHGQWLIRPLRRTLVEDGCVLFCPSQLTDVAQRNTSWSGSNPGLSMRPSTGAASAITWISTPPDRVRGLLGLGARIVHAHRGGQLVEPLVERGAILCAHNASDVGHPGLVGIDADVPAVVALPCHPQRLGIDRSHASPTRIVYRVRRNE